MDVRCYVSYPNGTTMMKCYHSDSLGGLSCAVSHIFLSHDDFSDIDLFEMADDINGEDTFRRYYDSLNETIYTFTAM